MTQTINVPAETATAAELRDQLYDTPLISSSVYHELPKILQKGCDLFPASSREKDIFFTGAITLVSGCFPNSYFYYDNCKLHFNFFAMIVAGPASGKGSINHAIAYVNKIEEHLHQQYKEMLDLHEVQVRNESSDTGSNAGKAYKQKPRRKRLVIPGNSSASSFLSILNDCDGSGIMFESEADTLAMAFKQDWSNYSDSLRKSYHHEPISFSRKMDDTFVEIKRPRLSLLMTGTPRQVGSMGLDNPENGLQSRFFFYFFDTLPVFKSLRGRSDSNMESSLESVGESMKDIYLQLSYNLEGIEFLLTDAQWKFFSRWYGKKLETVTRKYNAFSSALVMRGAVGTIRIAAILTFLYHAEKDPLFTQNKIYCSWRTLRKAILLVDTYLTHNLVIFQSSNLAAPDIVMHQYMDLYKLLPEGEFSRKDVLEIAAAVGFSERTVDRRLEKLRKSGRLVLVQGGIYKKK